MEVEIAWSYVAMYVDLCLCKLSARPKGSYGYSTDEVVRLNGLLRNAESVKVNPKQYVVGVVDQLRFEGRPPIHCLSVCDATGLVLYKRYFTRISREQEVQDSTFRMEQEHDLKHQVMMEIEAFSKVARHLFSGLSRKSFETHWEQVLSERRADDKLRHFDLMCKIPAVFKYLAPDVWMTHGRTLPTVGDTYLAVLDDPLVVEEFRKAFPIKINTVLCGA